jgi:hypothetical protein
MVWLYSSLSLPFSEPECDVALQQRDFASLMTQPSMLKAAKRPFEVLKQGLDLSVTNTWFYNVTVTPTRQKSIPKNMTRREPCRGLGALTEAYCLSSRMQSEDLKRTRLPTGSKSLHTGLLMFNHWIISPKPHISEGLNTAWLCHNVWGRGRAQSWEDSGG